MEAGQWQSHFVKASEWQRNINIFCWHNLQIIKLMRWSCINCTASFKWSISAVPCGHPTAPVNARLTNSGTTYHYEDQVEITCNLGYRLNGNNTITCEGDGRWSVIELFCESKLTITENEKSSIVSLKQFILR